MHIKNVELKKIFKIIIAIIIPLVVGGISAFLTREGTAMFKTINKPPLSPPAWLFPVAWTILYILMGYASYLIYKDNSISNIKIKNISIKLYIAQLIFNFFWSIIFFNMKQYFFAFVWLIVLWILILLLIINSNKINKSIKYLLIPYLLWVTFAGYLNIGIAILN